MSMDQKLTRLEKQLKYRLEPLKVVISIFGDRPLPEPHTNKGVHVFYKRRVVISEHKQSTG
jgi:hypothetical protein